MDNPPCPYRGLSAFREEDAPFFFGREEFTDQLLAALQHQPLVAVVGSSGVGKSSVVHAGLIPHLRRGGRWLIATFRPGNRPFQTLAGTLVDLLSPDLGETERLVEVRQLAAALLDGRVTLLDVVERVLDKHKNGQKPRLLLVADQFEELYALVSDADQRQRFLDVLFEGVLEQQDRDHPSFTLVLTLRADFMGQALAYRPVADALRDADVKLGPMTRTELTRAVVNPTHLQQVSFEPGLVARILQDVGHEPGNLPLLEFTMASLWDLQEHRQLTHQVYEAIGRVEGALGHYADAMLATLAPKEQEMARRIFTQLVQPGDGTEDTRRVATRSEIGEDAWPVVQKLATGRLLVTGQDSVGHETAEVIHEALIRCWDLLRTWMAEDRAFRVWQERLRVAMRNWESQGQDDGALMRGATLAVAEQWLAQRPENVGQAEALFIEESAKQNVRRTSERENIKATLALRERQLAASQAQGQRLRLIAFLLAAALIFTLVAYFLTIL